VRKLRQLFSGNQKERKEVSPPSRKLVPLDPGAIAADLERDGFAVFDFPEPDFDRLAAALLKDLKPHFEWRKVNYTGAKPDLRVFEGYTVSESVRRIATNPAIIDLLSEIYGRRAFPFQTLNFAVGSQQHVHADLVHFCARPPDFMCGVWVALEDIHEGAGPLLYYPGSHKWPVFFPENVNAPLGSKENPYEHYHLLEETWEAEITARGVEPVHFLAKKGQALLWHANLWHGGAPQTDPSLTRYSQVTHYFFEGCSYWTPLTGLERQVIAIEPATV
jgi:ectoine hydroxylase-related dioxygenase (phytanoyl-CoA dioxygenase family)